MAGVKSTLALVKSASSTPVAAAYAVFAVLTLLVYHYVAEGAFSSIMTMSAIVQCLGITFLCIQVRTSGSAVGISVGSLVLDACAFGFRLSSTTWLDGYLPVDASGDHVFQIVDLCSFTMVLWLLRQVLVVHRGTYQEDADEVRVIPIVAVCLSLAALLHADLNIYPLFDTFWMASLFMGVVAILPQLWLTARSGGRMEALTSHYVAALALSRVLSGMFMWEARTQLTCRPWVAGVNHAVYAILAAHVLHILLLGDFFYYYVRAIARQGFGKAVQLSGGDEWV